MRRAAVLLALLAGACAGPYPQIPPTAGVVAPPAWRTSIGPAQPVEAGWWRAFGDPVMNRLVDTALRDNSDVLIAVARINEARAQFRLARSALVPSIDAGGGIERLRDISPFGTSEVQTVEEPQVRLSYEVDLFGRLRSLRSAARASLAATTAARDATALGVAGAVASGYITLRSYDARLATARATLSARAEALRIAKRRADTGYTSKLELRQAESEYEATAQLIPQAQLAVTRQEDALNLLLGSSPAAVPRGATLDGFGYPAVPAGLPSDLLRRRPDIASAEQRIVSADASLASARANFLPRISLAASAGVAFSTLLPDPLTLFSFGTSALAPIFNGGRIRAQADSATAQRDQAAFAYRRTVLTAFREVEDSLAAVQRSGEQAEHVAAQRAALEQALRLATNRYRAGYASYIEQLDAQRQLLSADLTLIQARTDRLTASVSLYQAVGGGWASAPD
ncbi:efflux transporter outer membrane subunit [Glacieibacterium sp.]|uniref:efflux transporter outer membrane subunit n=1 Tax=Glacieibacterium sp. TaxID=2860237 RepID=UPI003B00735C